METAVPVQQPLHEYLRQHAREQPDKAAYVWYGRAISFAELDRASDAFAARLAQLGVKKGEPDARSPVFSPDGNWAPSSAPAVHCSRSTSCATSWTT